MCVSVKCLLLRIYEITTRRKIPVVSQYYSLFLFEYLEYEKSLYHGNVTLILKNAAVELFCKNMN